MHTKGTCFPAVQEEVWQHGVRPALEELTKRGAGSRGGRNKQCRASTGEPHTVSFGHPQSNPLQWQSFQFRITELTSAGQDFCLRCDPMSCSPTQRSTCHNSSEQTCVTFRDQVSVSLSPLPLPNTHTPDTPPALN